MEAIVEWLNGSQEYEVGIELYNQFGDGSLNFLFKMSRTSFTESKLKAALSGLCGNSPDQVSEDSKNVVMTKKNDLPEIVIEILRNRTRNHEALFHQTNDVDRFEIAKRIKEDTRALDQYFDHGVVPVNSDPEEVAVEVPVNAWEMHELHANNKSYISKNKNRPSKSRDVEVRVQQNKMIQSRLKSMNYAD